MALPCPFDPECTGQAWAPVYSIIDLHKALTGAMDSDPDIVCTVHGGFDDVDQEADDHDLDDGPEGRADLEAQFADGPLMSRAADGPHPHLLTPAEPPAGDEWWHGCPECHLPIQGGAAGLAAPRRTVPTYTGVTRRPITIWLDH